MQSRSRAQPLPMAAGSLIIIISGKPNGTFNLCDAVVVKVPLSCRDAPCAQSLECFELTFLRELANVAVKDQLAFPGEGAKGEIMHGLQGQYRVNNVLWEADYQFDGDVLESSADIEDEIRHPLDSVGHFQVDVIGGSGIITDV